MERVGGDEQFPCRLAFHRLRSIEGDRRHGHTARLEIRSLDFFLIGCAAFLFIFVGDPIDMWRWYMGCDEGAREEFLADRIRIHLRMGHHRQSARIATSHQGHRIRHCGVGGACGDDLLEHHLSHSARDTSQMEREETRRVSPRVDTIRSKKNQKSRGGKDKD